MDSAEDFMQLRLHTHVVAAAKTILSLHYVKSVHELSRMIILNFMHLPNFDFVVTSDDSTNGVYVYATELFSLGWVWHGFYDARLGGW